MNSDTSELPILSDVLRNLAANRRPPRKHHARSIGGGDQTRTTNLRLLQNRWSPATRREILFQIDETFSMEIGTFCETVIKTREPLLVANALEDNQWKVSCRDSGGDGLRIWGLPVVLA